MSLSLTCDACARTIKVKDEYAGRKIRCPGCQETLLVPEAEDDFLEEAAPAVSRTATKSARKPAKSRSRSGDRTSPWIARHWQWFAVLAMLGLALIPVTGLKIALLGALIGLLLAFIGGIVPFFRIMAGDPGTALTMIFSRSARFDMLDRPDNHPYKVLVRNAFGSTRGLFWRGLLLFLTFFPAASINSRANVWFQVPLAPGEARLAMSGPPPGHVPERLPAPGHQVSSASDPERESEPEPEPEPAALAANDPFVRPQMPGMPPQMAPRPATGGNDARVFYATLGYGEFAGEGSPDAAITEVITTLPGYVADTLQIDPAAKQATFQHRGAVTPQAVGPALARKGFRSLSFTGSANPPQ